MSQTHPYIVLKDGKTIDIRGPVGDAANEVNRAAMLGHHLVVLARPTGVQVAVAIREIQKINGRIG